MLCRNRDAAAELTLAKRSRLGKPGLAGWNQPPGAVHENNSGVPG